MSASAPAFRPVVKADGPRPVSGGTVLLLDVLAQDREGRSADRPSEAEAGPKAFHPPVVVAQFGELLRIRREDTPVSELTNREIAAFGGRPTSEWT